MNTLTPRLRNSSINGTRFMIDLDSDVQRHLRELNLLLGKTAFNTEQVAGIDTIENLKVKINAISSELKPAEKQALNHENEANKEEKNVAEAQGAIRLAEDMHKTTTDETVKKFLKDTLDTKKKELDKISETAKAARLKATTSNSEFQNKKAEADQLSSDLNQALLGATTVRRFYDNDEPHFDLEDALNKPLLAKKTESDHWDPSGILFYIREHEATGSLSISDCIDKVNKLSNLKHAFQQYISEHGKILDDNQRSVLNINMFPNLSDYLLSYGYWIKGITEVNAMFNFVKTHKNGAKALVDYAVVSTARYKIQKASLQIEVVNGKTYNDDDHPLIKKILDSGLKIHEEVFAGETDKILKDFIANDKEADLIDFGLNALKITDMPSSYYSTIIGYMRKSLVEIDKDNITYFLPIFINRIKSSTTETEEDVESPVESDQDFDVEFPDDEKTTIKTNASNIKCASQLFSSMVMDLDLDIFNLTNFLTNNYLIRNRIDIEDKRLRQNLQMFVFSNRFIDVKSGERMDRTDAGERQHFYRQVFNAGNGQIPEGVIVNYKFPKLWKQLIPAVKEYLENAASSLSEDTFISKGGVMQIVSGLKNNLSANCTSMAKIISPIINAEWNFIITKILGHPEIIKQVSPALGTWKGVAETLFAEMKHSNIDASLIYDKARLSNAILRAVADYYPRQFEENENFISFCSMVIELDSLNNSISEDMMEMPEDDAEAAKAEQEAYGNNNGMPKLPQGNNGAKSDWDF